MIITLMVITLVAALAGTVTTVTINNLQASQAAQDAGIAVNTADAGVAQGLSYLRANGVSALCPAPSSFDKTTPTFNNAFNLASRSCVDSATKGTKLSGHSYSVLIVTEKAYQPAGTGTYWIYSTGSGKAAGKRQISAKVEVTGAGGGGMPGGFFGHAILGSGQTYINQSIFTTGCVYKRSHINMSGIDAYGLPAAVHSSQIITEDNGTNEDCSESKKSLHTDAACNTDAPFDQDMLGGNTAMTACLTRLRSYPGYGPAMETAWTKYYGANGSLIANDQALFDLFSIKDPALTDDQRANLRRIADAQGNLRINDPSAFTPDDQQAVVYYDLRATGGNVDLRNIGGFTAPADGSCPTRSLVIVIDGGGTIFHNGGPLVASIYITSPGKMYYANGGTLVGSVYADKISLGGNTVARSSDIECFNKNPSPALLDFNITSYRELDSVN